MALKHGRGTAPAWTTGCLGPFLFCVGAFAAGAIALGKPMNLANGAALVLALLLALMGAWIAIDHFRGK